MALTLTSTIDAEVRELHVTGTVDAEIEPGYQFRIGTSDELLLLRNFADGTIPQSAGNPLRVGKDPNTWLVERGTQGSAAEGHTSGATVFGATDAFTSGSNQDTPVVFPPGGGGAVDSVNGQTGVVTTPLAEVLAQGNDTGGLGIVSDATGSDDAVVDTTATSVDGIASAVASAITSGDGSASVDAVATVIGGNGSATANRYLQVDTGAGSADTAIAANGAAGTASASTSLQTGDGDALATVHAQAFGDGNTDVSTRSDSGGAGNATADTTATSVDGTASARSTATSSFGTVSIGPVADATSALIMVTGLPTSDPGVAGALYTAAGVLMVSAG